MASVALDITMIELLVADARRASSTALLGRQAESSLVGRA